MAKTIQLVFGGPTSASREGDVNEWYVQRLEQMCSLPAITAAHLFRPAKAQLPRTKANLPQTLAIYEYDTLDLSEVIDGMKAAIIEGEKRGTYEAGESFPGPPEGSFAFDSSYRSAHYNLVSHYPRPAEWTQFPHGMEWNLTADTIFMVFGGPTKPALLEEVMRWYVDAHLEEVCSMAGFVTGQLFRPSSTQAEGGTDGLPEILSFLEYETDDLAATIDDGFAAHLEGMKRRVYEPGQSVPGPAEDIWALNPQHQSAFYELVARYTDAK